MTPAAFWKQFVDIAPRLDTEDAAADALFDLVERLGPLGVEFGPGVERYSRLVLSPRGDAKLLAKTRAIIAAAPALPDWELFPAKPARPGATLDFVVPLFEQGIVTFDASTWRYATTAEATLVIEVPATLAKAPTRDLAPQLMTVVLDAALGEALRLDTFPTIELTPKLKREPEGTLGELVASATS